LRAGAERCSVSVFVPPPVTLKDPVASVRIAFFLAALARALTALRVFRVTVPMHVVAPAGQLTLIETDPDGLTVSAAAPAIVAVGAWGLIDVFPRFPDSGDGLTVARGAVGGVVGGGGGGLTAAGMTVSVTGVLVADSPLVLL
jgi:hypothetical protein